MKLRFAEWLISEEVLACRRSLLGFAPSCCLDIYVKMWHHDAMSGAKWMNQLNLDDFYRKLENKAGRPLGEQFKKMFTKLAARYYESLYRNSI